MRPFGKIVYMNLYETSMGGKQKEFAQTTGRLLARLREENPKEYQAGLEILSQRYWKPIYTYIRAGWASTSEDAKDMTQAFFLWLFEGDTLRRYNRERGAFRTYLKTLLRHFMTDRDRALQRLKRGGNVLHISINFEEESQPASYGEDPETLFDRAWKAELVRRAVEQARRHFASTGREHIFRTFEEYELSPSTKRRTYREVADDLGIKEGDVRNHLFSAREKICDEIRRELAETALDEESLEHEWNLFLER